MNATSYEIGARMDHPDFEAIFPKIQFISADDTSRLIFVLASKRQRHATHEYGGNQMRSLITVILAAAGAVGLAACGGPKESAPASASAPAADAAAAEPAAAEPAVEPAAV